MIRFLPTVFVKHVSADGEIVGLGEGGEDSTTFVSSQHECLHTPSRMRSDSHASTLTSVHSKTSIKSEHTAGVPVGVAVGVGVGVDVEAVNEGATAPSSQQDLAHTPFRIRSESHVCNVTSAHSKMSTKSVEHAVGEFDGADEGLTLGAAVVGGKHTTSQHVV